MKLINRAEFLQYTMMALAITLGIIGVFTSIQIVIIGLIIAILTFTITPRLLNPAKCSFLDKFAKKCNYLTTGYFWRHIKAGDTFTFIRHVHYADKTEVKIMKVLVMDRDRDLILNYSGDNVMFDGSPINITKSVGQNTFLESVLKYWGRLDYVSWNGKSIKICL